MSMDRDPNVYDRETRVYDRDSRGSNTLAYLIGGLVLALGLLAFLFYDGGTGDVNTTSSTGTQTERPAGATSPGAAGSTTVTEHRLGVPRRPRPHRPVRPPRSNKALGSVSVSCVGVPAYGVRARPRSGPFVCLPLTAALPEPAEAASVSARDPTAMDEARAQNEVNINAPIGSGALDASDLDRMPYGKALSQISRDIPC